MTRVHIKVTGKDLKEINQKLLDIADSIALEYESYIQHPEEREAYYKEECCVITLDDATGEEYYGTIINPIIPKDHWSYVLHSGRYRSEGGKHICDRGIQNFIP